MSAKNIFAQVVSVKKITNEVFLIALSSPHLLKNVSCGQFLHIKIPGAILRRPLSVHDVRENKIFILFRVRGKGTAALSGFKAADKLDVIGPLGKGFRLDKCELKEGKNILIAGGIGVAPLLFLARQIVKISKKAPILLVGAKYKNDILAASSFKQLGCKVFIATDDGSLGIKGSVIDLLRKVLLSQEKVNIFACGPQVMFKALSNEIKNRNNIKGQVSFEQFMGCGIGTCCGCTVETKHGYKKACKDGPVFDINEVF